MSVLAYTCCCGNSGCDGCPSLFFTDELASLCCKNKDDVYVVQIKRPARVAKFCVSPTGVGPCVTGSPVSITLTYEDQDDLIGVYEYESCLWITVRDVDVPPETNPCDGTGGSAACGSVYSLFGSGIWSVYRNETCLADPTKRWFADIQCYNGGDYITFAMWPYSPTVYSGGECSRGANDGSTYYLIDYYLCTIHREYTWRKACDSGNFGEGNFSADCMIPDAIRFAGAGCPIFEFDLLLATDETRWGSQALDPAVAEAFICAIRQGLEPDQTTMDAVCAHPALMCSTADWRYKQTTDDAYLAIVYPTEYGPCGPQTNEVGLSIHKSWPALQPELVTAAAAVYQADCLPTPTMAMESNPEWVIRRNTYFRPRPLGWSWECADSGSCTDGVWTGECLRYDGQPRSTPTCTSNGPGSPCTCDWCGCFTDAECDGCPPTLAVNPCPSEAECIYKMYAASCDGVFFRYGESFLKDCQPYTTCIAQPGWTCTDCEHVIEYGYYLYDHYQNSGFIYPVTRNCEAIESRIPWRCGPLSPPESVAALFNEIEGTAMLARGACSNILNYLGGGEGECVDGRTVCPDCTDCLGFAGTPIPSSVIDDGGIDGTLCLEGAPEAYDACTPVCWTADPAVAECTWVTDTLPCLTPPSDPCP